MPNRTDRVFARRRALLAALLLASTAFAAPAAAQDGAAASAADDTGNDIIVTARRREESLQDVPIAVTAISGAALEAAGTQDITEIAENVPNVTVEATRGSNNTLASFIRGVGQQDPVAGFEAGVGLYLDDVYLNRPQAAVLDVFDVERIEVLRGPQGTLYGRNTIGGAIKYVTRRLSTDPMLKVRATYGTYDQAELVVTTSIPVTDALRVGISGARLSRGGFGDNLNIPGRENYNKDIYTFRGSAEYEADKVFLRVSADYLRDKSDPKQGHRLFPGLFSGAPVLDSVYDTRAGLDGPRQYVESYGGSLTGEFEMSDALKLKSVTAYRQDYTQTPIDFDSLPTRDVDVPAIYKNKQFSQEFQAIYSSDTLNGLIGAYYLDANAFDVFDTILASTGALLGLPGFTASTLGDVDTKTWSIFGDFTYDVTDQIAISVGGRYTSDKRSSRILRRNVINGPVPELGGAGTTIATTSNFNGSKTFKEFTPRASISFKPSDDHTLYASYSKGFKGGGFDPRGLTTAAPDTNRNGVKDPDEIFDFLLFDPEKVDSYELGWKASLFDRRLSFALAGFYADYQDVQIPGSFGFDSNGDGINDTFVGITSNAAKAKIKGVEFEGLAKLARDFAGSGSALNFAFSLGYIDAQYKRFINAQGLDVSNTATFQNTPKWTASGTLTMTVPVGPGALDVMPNVSYRSRTSQFEQPSLLDQAGYTLYDLSAVYRSDDDRWSFGVHGKNLSSKKYKTAGYVFGARNAAGNFVPSLGREGILTAFSGPPRQVFATLGLKF